MAHYDRRILVPYLRDVCCVEMLCRKLEQDVQHAKVEADKYAGWANAKYEDPKRPDWDNYKDDQNEMKGAVTFLLGFGVPGLLLMGIPMIGPLLGLGGIGLGVLLFGICYKRQRENDAVAEYKYEEAMERYRKKCASNKENREKQHSWRESSKRWRNKQNELKGKLDAAKNLRSDVYSVNVIPSRYRTVHAAYYLYDYFDSGRETDLDKIIQTMLLDEIVRKMDRLIAQNSEILLNQRMMLAQQERRDRDDHDRHLEQMRQIARLEQNQQRQLDNQNMIARNQQVTNFFLEADYLRKRI